MPEPDPHVLFYTSFMQQVLQAREWMSGTYLVSELGIKKAEGCSETRFILFRALKPVCCFLMTQRHSRVVFFICVSFPSVGEGWVWTILRNGEK